MRTKYCCCAKDYENYYLHQVGHGVPFYSGAPYQNGFGLSNIFGAIARSITPLLKSGAKALGKQALKSGVAFASDVLGGANAKQAAIRHAKAAGSSLLQQTVKRKPMVKRKTSQNPVKKKRRKKYNDIFS